jgi:hypothetical protein
MAVFINFTASSEPASFAAESAVFTDSKIVARDILSPTGFINRLFFPHQDQMFSTLGLALALAAVLFIGYLLVRAYFPNLFVVQRETFVNRPPPTGPPVPTPVNLPDLIPAPAPPVKMDPPMEKRVVSPGGPNAPNVMADTPPTISPEVNPTDPYDDNNMEAPIKDSMRHPEMSFGPGVDNSGMNKLATSGVGSTKVAASESPFSPDFAQNGGTFMGSVFANDLTKDDRYATF